MQIIPATEDPAGTTDMKAQKAKDVRFALPAAEHMSPTPLAAERSQTTSVDDLAPKLSATTFGETGKFDHIKPGDDASILEEGEVNESAGQGDTPSRIRS